MTQSRAPPAGGERHSHFHPLLQFVVRILQLDLRTCGFQKLENWHPLAKKMGDPNGSTGSRPKKRES